ncbi:MAG TPA: YkgJ family cysteine cluster protein [Cytophagales bacterium]|nr:YkgJ family cysteine cluster protein [Cytophagales bacterium]
MKLDIEKLKEKAAQREESTKKVFNKLKKSKPKDLDKVFHSLHEETFDKIDCLECANCCKTTSPIFYQPDIERAGKALRMKVPDFIAQYLHKDSDGDYVLNESPCPFLAGDNTCIIYENRPTACREYPHTNRKRMYQILDLTLKNTSICPAVFHIVEELKEKMA